MSPAVLIFSSERDAHIPFVTRHLPEGAALIADPSTLHKGSTIGYSVHDASVEVTYAGRSLHSIKSVWYRKPAHTLKKELPVPDGFKAYVEDGYRLHYAWLRNRFEHALWVSDYYALLKAEDKVTQLIEARKLGFATPETIVTSNADEARSFLAKHQHAIVKPLSGQGFPVIKDGLEHVQLLFATKLTRGQDVDLDNLDLAPSFFQEAVQDITADIRVTVIGDRAFAAAITTPGLDTKLRVRDWRAGYQMGTLLIEEHTLPETVAKQCADHVRAMGLNFGALDLILDRHGVYWFIENNPNGQWAFVEEATGQPIGKALAELLLSPLSA